MLHVIGVDIGSMSTKATLLSDGKISCWALTLTTPDAGEAASQQVVDEVLAKGKLSQQDIAYIVATGYGRYNVPFADKNITEISCHARGTHWLFPDTDTLLDMGGQDLKVMKFDENGKVTDFQLNDRCAAGTGRFLERAASTLEISLEEIGPRSLDLVEGPAAVSSTCTVFAERDILELLQQGRHPNDMLGGICDSLTKRISAMIRRVGIERNLSISGGIAKNLGIVRRLEDVFGIKAYIFTEPQVVGAIGAALFAHEAVAGEMPPRPEDVLTYAHETTITQETGIVRQVSQLM